MAARIAGAVVLLLVVLPSTLTAQIAGLASASLPTRPEVSSAPSPVRDVFVASPGTYGQPSNERPSHRSRRDRSRRYHGGHPRGAIGGAYVTSEAIVVEAPPLDAEPAGFLALHVEPATAQVYVDGEFIGEVNAFRPMLPGRRLPAGTHRVELRAPGYQTVTFDVRIHPRETATYRNTLQPEGPAKPPVAAGPPRTFYVIPGCYAGDKHPRSVPSLPARCDVSKVRNIAPVVSLAARAR